MRRFAAFVFLGIVGTVFGLSKLHAVRHGYDFTGSFRFGWAIVYRLAVDRGVRLGFPTWAAAAACGEGAAAAARISAVTISMRSWWSATHCSPRRGVRQRPDPRPWYVVCTIIATGGRIRAEERDRVVVVGDFDEGETVSRELADAPERPESGGRGDAARRGCGPGRRRAVGRSGHRRRCDRARAPEHRA
jgi:hypothetical protein